MPIRRSTYTRRLVAIAIAVPSLYANAQQPPSPSRVQGTIKRIDGDVLSVKARRGNDVKLHMIGDIRVVGITKILLSDIKVGSFIGATTVPGPDGMPTAVEVHVFSKDMRGTGQESRSHWSWWSWGADRRAVAESVVGNNGHTLLVKSKDGENKIVVTPDTPVVAYVPAAKSDLKAGAGVFAFVNKKLPDGSFETNRISVDRDGITPPMGPRGHLELDR
jgi:hypothetical protein